MSALRLLFNFKKPVLNHFDFLDIVVQDKVLLLISWNFKHKYLLSIPILRRRFRQLESAVILTLPSSIDYVTIRISSIWRKRIIKIALKKFKLDEQSSMMIIQQFKPFYMPHLNAPLVQMKVPTALGKMPFPILKNSNVSLRDNEIMLQNEKLIYHQ